MFAGKDHAIAGQVVRPARFLDRSTTGRGGRGLHETGERGREGGREPKLARSHRAGPPLEGHVVGGRLQQPLDLVRRRVGILVEDEGGGSGSDRGRFGGAAAAHEPSVEDGLAVDLLVDIRAQHPEALDVNAGGDEIRGAGRAGLRGGGEVGHRVVGKLHRVIRVRRADRDDPLVEGRVCQRRRRSLGLVSAVAGRRDDDDAGFPRLLDGEGQGVDPVPLRRVRAVGQVEDADVQAVVIAVLDDPVDRRDDLRDVRPAVGRGDLDAHDVRVGSHPAVGRRGCSRVRGGEGAVPTGDQAGHERSVAVGVEVGQIGRLGLACRIQSLDRGDAGVDQRDADPLARVTSGPPRLRARVVGREGHGVDIARRVVVARSDDGGREGRHQQRHGQDGAQSAATDQVEAPAGGGRHRSALAGRIHAPASPASPT